VGVRAGIPEATLAALEGWRTSARFTPRERAALAFAEAIVGDAPEVDAATLAQVRAHFSEAETVELALAVGFQLAASAFAKACGVAPQGFATAPPGASETGARAAEGRPC